MKVLYRIPESRRVVVTNHGDELIRVDGKGGGHSLAPGRHAEFEVLAGEELLVPEGANASVTELVEG